MPGGLQPGRGCWRFLAPAAARTAESALAVLARRSVDRFLRLASMSSAAFFVLFSSMDFTIAHAGVQARSHASGNLITTTGATNPGGTLPYAQQLFLDASRSSIYTSGSAYSARTTR